MFITRNRQQIMSVLAGLMSWAKSGRFIKTSYGKQFNALFLV